jgi:rod shape-determining protein MreC
MTGGFQRWWTRNQGQLLGVVLLIAVAFGIRQTQGELLLEVWRWLNWPVMGALSTPPPNLTGNRIVELEGRVTGLEAENQRLKALLNLADARLGMPLAAQVIGRDGDHWWRFIILNRGSADGVLKGTPVTTPGGLVGEIVAVSPHASRVLLLSDPLSKVGVVVARTGAMAVLSGQYRSEAIIELFDSQAQIKVGDTLVTSGLSSRFPGNITIGKVISLPDKRTETLQVKVRFSALLDSVEWVNVYPNATKVDAQPIP